LLFSYWVSYQKETSVNYPMKNFIQLKENAKSWRKMMEYFNFYKYNVAVNVLKDFDTYGCYYQDPIVFPYHYKYYAGNFWWSKSSYIKHLPPLLSKNYKNRYWAENWLCQNARKIFSAFNTSAELYAVRIPSSIYPPPSLYGNKRRHNVAHFIISHYFYLIRYLLSKLGR